MLWQNEILFVLCSKHFLVLNKGENEELPEPDISGVESGTIPDRKADEQPQGISS